MPNKDFYYRFEEKNRGSRDLIKERLKVYLPFILKCKEAHKDCLALDIGCGRGEWLELMADNGVRAKGIDLDDGMLGPCRERGFDVEKADALEALRKMPDDSLSIVSGFHIAEHLPFDILLQVVHEAKRVLKPAGLLILETPNPENLCVGACNFYIDSTHNHPLPPPLLSFLPEYEGFFRVKILRLQEDKSLAQAKNLSLFNAIAGASPDYSIVAQKEASQEILSSFGDLFEKNFGITMHELCQKYDAGQEQRAAQQESIFAEQERRIAEQECRIAEQNATLVAQTQRIDALQKKLDETYNLLVNTRHRTLYGALAWLFRKVFRR